MIELLNNDPLTPGNPTGARTSRVLNIKLMKVDSFWRYFNQWSLYSLHWIHWNLACWLFILKNVPVFFSRRQKNMHNIARKSPPPPPKHCACVFYAIGGRGEGGWTFKNVFEALFPRLWKKKTQGHFLTQKESAYHISADSEQLE